MSMSMPNILVLDLAHFRVHVYVRDSVRVRGGARVHFQHRHGNAAWTSKYSMD
jgi:hypothetical protein